jgi:hypothetical protein
MQLVIDEDEAITMIDELSRRTGKAPGVIVVEALKHQMEEASSLEKLATSNDYASNDPLAVRLERIAQAQYEFSQLPLPEGMNMDEWMYDDYGLPR